MEARDAGSPRAVTVLVRLSDEARQQADHVRAWWRANRLGAPTLFEDEVAAALGLLATHPQVGKAARVRGARGVRRVLLPATRYHLYYTTDATGVLVVSLWSAVRRRGPSLRVH